MSETMDILLTFHATSAAMRAEKCCQAEEMEAKLRPVPRELSSSCGLALELNQVRLASLKETLKANNIDTEAIYHDDAGYEQIE